MTVKLLTEHHLEFLSLIGGYTGSSVYTCQNATLLEITSCGSNFVYLDLCCEKLYISQLISLNML